MELGWTEEDAKKVVHTNKFPSGANTDEMVQIILKKVH
jgi:hypothetical protein